MRPHARIKSGTGHVVEARGPGLRKRAAAADFVIGTFRHARCQSLPDTSFVDWAWLSRPVLRPTRIRAQRRAEPRRWRRERTSSFPKTLCRCHSTVRGSRRGARQFPRWIGPRARVGDLSLLRGHVVARVIRASAPSRRWLGVPCVRVRRTLKLRRPHRQPDREPTTLPNGSVWPAGRRPTGHGEHMLGANRGENCERKSEQLRPTQIA